MEQNSGVKFHEAQVAQGRQWVGNDTLTTQKEITLAISQPTTEGIVPTDGKTPPKTETVPFPATEEEARQIVEKFESGAEHLRGDENVSDSVAQHMLHDSTSLLDEAWLGTPEEELNAYVASSCLLEIVLIWPQIRVGAALHPHQAHDRR